MPAVVLVGRPNTGKSTLFNRLVGGRIAITLSEPGITRDRLIRSAEWLGHRFDVIDTGGLVPNATDEISQQVERQVRVALSEADVIVLVVDGVAGCTPLDEEIASRLRQESRSFVVAVNKRDVKRGFDPAEFYHLGASHVLPISAEHGTGVDELLDEIIRLLPAQSPCSPSPPPVSLALLGRPNVGKSSFLNSLLGHERSIVTPIPGTTRDVVEDRIVFEGRTFRLLDTAGIRKPSRVSSAVEYFSVSRALDTIQRCDVALLVIDATEGPTNQEKKIANLIDSHSRGMVVVANKMDLVPPRLDRKVRKWVKDQLAFVGYAPVVFCSALKNQGVLEAVRQAAVVYDSGSRRISRSLLREAVVSQLEQKPPRYDCRITSLVQTGIRPPTFRLRATDPEAVSATYLRFVESTIRTCFNFAGYPLRLKVMQSKK